MNKMCGSGLQTIIIHTSYIPVSQNPSFPILLTLTGTRNSTCVRVTRSASPFYAPPKCDGKKTTTRLLQGEMMDVFIFERVVRQK